ncbi:coiled-coil domain-containing protein 80-like isoform X2 [Amblyraja radiata]|uniref:coiled-coil domain-containing protein 80-like isoform X2 n=1 Tax=Amblyraja radiata TaxID=386614 RepID=UPI00140350BB|nr:coiled-coil domain-containing protein 80-like isoform X2 [Amblyraja radiata]
MYNAAVTPGRQLVNVLHSTHTHTYTLQSLTQIASVCSKAVAEIFFFLSLDCGLEFLALNFYSALALSLSLSVSLCLSLHVATAEMGAGCRPLTTCLLLVSALRAGSGDGSVPSPGSKDTLAAALNSPAASSGPLGRHFGKSRLLVISAPGPLDTSYRLMERQVDLGKGALRCDLALRDLLVMVLFQGTRPTQGKLLRVSKEGKVLEEKLGPEEVEQVTRKLSLEASQFGMVLLRKSLHVYERFPYAVRVEAVMEAVDQMPLRKLESMTRRAQKLKCKGSRAGRISGQVHARRKLANRTTSIGTMFNRSPLNRTKSIGTMANRSLVNRTASHRTMPNRSGIRTVRKGSPANPRYRPGSPNSRNPFRSSSRRFPEKSGEAVPGKRNALTSTRGSDGERKAKAPRSPVNVKGREMVDHLMGQIKQKVRQMMAVNSRHPLQRRPGGQVFQVGPHRNFSSGPPTVAPMGASIDLSGAVSQPPHTATPSSSSGQPVNPEEVTTLDSSSGTARSQGDHDGWTTVSVGPLPHLGEGDWTREPQEVSPTLASGLDTPRTRKGQTHPPEPTTPHSTREEGGGGQRGPEGRAPGVATASPAPGKAKKAGRKDRENSGKGSRGKGRKNRRNRKNRNKNKKQGARGDEQSGSQLFLQQFLNKRRLLVITSPSKDSRLHVQQRDEYLEHVCQLALRRISVVNILGSPTNSSLTVEHYQTENEQALEIPVTEPVGPEVITELRKDFGMTFDEFFMVLVDYDMKVKQYFDVPIPIKVLVDYMDTFPSRLPEIQEERRRGVTCIKGEGRLNINKFLARFQWKRRLLIISTPYEEDWAFQQQLTALTGQECNLGIRHFAVLKMMGSGEEASGSLELLPANGRSQVETESLSWAAVSGLREHYQVSEEHFMMLLTGKDGAIHSWYLSPMWSLAAMYEQLDSTPARQEEMRLQQSLGVECHRDEDDYPGYNQRG